MLPTRFLLEAESTPGPQCSQKDYVLEKFQLNLQCLNQLHHCLSPFEMYLPCCDIVTWMFHVTTVMYELESLDSERDSVGLNMQVGPVWRTVFDGLLLQLLWGSKTWLKQNRCNLYNWGFPAEFSILYFVVRAAFVVVTPPNHKCLNNWYFLCMEPQV
jgi:hypothetical protein